MGKLKFMDVSIKCTLGASPRSRSVLSVYVLNKGTRVPPSSTEFH
jgi:hypothetical protein